MFTPLGRIATLSQRLSRIAAVHVTVKDVVDLGPSLSGDQTVRHLEQLGRRRALICGSALGTASGAAS